MGGLIATPGDNVEFERVEQWLCQVWLNHTEALAKRVATGSEWETYYARERLEVIRDFTQKNAHDVAQAMRNLQGYTKVSVAPRFGFAPSSLYSSHSLSYSETDVTPYTLRKPSASALSLNGLIPQGVIKIREKPTRWELYYNSMCLVAETTCVVLENWILGPYEVILYPWCIRRLLETIEFVPIVKDREINYMRRLPHWRYPHHACWGSFGSIVEDLMECGMVIEPLNALRRYANSYEPNDCLVRAENIPHAVHRPTSWNSKFDKSKLGSFNFRRGAL